jgi:hypothetical protein
MSTHTVPGRGNESGSGSGLVAADDVLDAEFVDHDKTEPGDDLGAAVERWRLVTLRPPPPGQRRAVMWQAARDVVVRVVRAPWRLLAAFARGGWRKFLAGERSGRAVPVRYVVIAALVHGSGYERLARSGCSDRTIRRRLREWATAGHGTARADSCRSAASAACCSGSMAPPVLSVPKTGLRQPQVHVACTAPSSSGTTAV